MDADASGHSVKAPKQPVSRQNRSVARAHERARAPCLPQPPIAGAGSTPSGVPAGSVGTPAL